MRMNVDRKIREAKVLERQGDISQALRLYEDVVGQFPANPRAKRAISHLKLILETPSRSVIQDVVKAYSQRKFDFVLTRTEHLLSQFPNSEKLWTLRGAAATALGQHGLAEDAFRQSVTLWSDHPSPHANLGASFDRQGKTSDALRCYSAAIELSPKHAGYYLSRGNTYLGAGDLSAAISDMQTATRLGPENAGAFNFLGQAYRDSGDIRSAMESFQTAVRLDAKSPPIQLNLGTSYLEIGDLCRAIRHLELAVSLDPQSASARNNLGSAQFSSRQYDQAMHSCMAAIALKPDHAGAYQNLANVQQHLGQIGLAVASYEAATGLDETLHAAQAQKLHFQAKMCDWKAVEEFDVMADTLGTSGQAAPPWPLLAFEDNPARQKLRSAQYATQWHDKRPEFGRQAGKSRLRIGYFSNDLSDHATMFLLNGVLENHNQVDFEIFVYCLNEPKQSRQLDRLILNVENFVDVHLASDDDIVTRARQDELDIAIDLKGYTQDARSGPFFSGLAPIQINYLGYPGTMGTPCMDYMIADPVVVPPNQRDHYSEQIIYLPDSYQPNDDQRAISQAPVSRAMYGLPEDAVVICCFNSSYKIMPEEFDIWMRVLLAVPDAVLWLLGCNTWAKANLQQAARDRGVDKARLIFADSIAHDAHLARHRLADIFVDTFNVNAHTTASDALWVGLPVVTKAGSQFAARVAASLLTAVGMEDLITENAQQYEGLITRLAQDKTALAEVKKRLQDNLTTTALYDTVAYTRYLEEGFRQVWERRELGGSPQDIWIERADSLGDKDCSRVDDGSCRAM